MRDLKRFVIMPVMAYIGIMGFRAPVAFGHEGHHHAEHHQTEELKAQESRLSGESLYQLGSSWKNQNGEPVRLESLAGRPRLISLLYTSCISACPMLVSDMKSLVSQLSKSERDKIGLAVFSFDPDRDTPEALTKFASKLKLDPKQWTLLSPMRASDVTEIAAALGVQFKKLESGDYIHSNVIFLLNEKGEIVAQKEGLKTVSAEFSKKLKDELKRK